MKRRAASAAEVVDRAPKMIDSFFTPTTSKFVRGQNARKALLMHKLAAGFEKSLYDPCFNPVSFKCLRQVLKALHILELAPKIYVIHNLLSAPAGEREMTSSQARARHIRDGSATCDHRVPIGWNHTEQAVTAETSDIAFHIGLNYNSFDK